MTKLTTETLKEIIGSYPEGSDEIECLMAQKLLAYEQAPAQPVIPERPELRYGDNVLWFLNELAAFDASDIDSDDFDVYGEDRNGMEGCATISITELAADAAKLLSAQPVSEPYKLAKSPEACAWISDGEGLWLGDCGLTWTFFDDGPNENGLKYCPSCGKKVSFIAAPAQESE